jgi:hypothetical protein
MLATLPGPPELEDPVPPVVVPPQAARMVAAETIRKANRFMLILPFRMTLIETLREL